jgi:hypothetical protein
MKITKEWLIERGACRAGKDWFAGQKETDGTKIVEKLTCKDEEKNAWANWLIVRLMAREQHLAYAIFAAEQVISIFEKKFPKDDLPRKAIEAAKAVLKNDTPENRAAAGAAAGAAWAAGAAGAAWAAGYAGYAARAAGYAAWAAGYAAGYAAWDAAGAAGYAVWAAGAAAWAAGYAAWDAAWADGGAAWADGDAAWAAAGAAARIKMQVKILKYGLRLFAK